MRSFLALGLLITLCASASAAPARHSRHIIVHSGHEYAIPDWAHSAPRSVPYEHEYAVPDWGYTARSVPYEDAPSYNDPSKSGCCN